MDTPVMAGTNMTDENISEEIKEQEVLEEQETQDEREAQEGLEAKEEPPPPPPPQKPDIIVTIGSEALSATVLFRRMAEETIPPNKDDVLAALNEKGVTSGIDENAIVQICKDLTFDALIEVARGKAATKGKDGEAKYLIDRKRELRPSIGEDGLADYRNLGLVHNVEKGQALCEIIPPTKGEDGFTVYGAVLDGPMGRDAIVPTGKNTTFDEERMAVVAEVDGNVEVAPNGIINIQDVLRINGNVNNATGNINFVGDVIITGDVASGFKVISKGDITIKGTVEGAVLTAEGNIVVGGSINGMGSARITAGKSVRCKNIQNCNIVTGEDVYADSLMYCVVQCSGNMELSGKHGTLIGGQNTIAKVLSAKTIGTQSHVATVITMAGGGLKHNEKIGEIKREITSFENEMISLVQTITWCQELITTKKELKLFQMKAFEKARTRLPLARVDLDKKKKELEVAQKALVQIKPEDTYIRCGGRIHSGVKFIFGIQTMSVQSSFANCRIYLADGEITVTAM